MPALLPLPILRPAATDADLLGRFVRDRDEAAFAELVRRFGPLVLGVCRRVVPDAHLAEDAFQAAFVVLARKASEVRPATLPHWLYGVARKVALRARTMAGRRAKRETLTAAPPEVAALPPEPDDTAALDAAIADLPAVYREAVILCELSGVSRTDAATRLGIAEGTLSSRLAKARKLLAAALSRKGIGLPAVLAVAIPPALFGATVRAATDHAPAAVSALADGVTRLMLLSKLKRPALAGLVTLVAVGWLAIRLSQPEPAVAAEPKDAADAGILWMLHAGAGELIGHTPDGKKVRTVKLAAGVIDDGIFLGISRDGRYAILAAAKGVVPAGREAGVTALKGGKLTIHLRPLFDGDTPAETGIPVDHRTTVVRGHDGQTLFVTRPLGDRVPTPDEMPKLSDFGSSSVTRDTTAYDLTTLKGVKLPLLPDSFRRVEQCPNGDWVLEVVDPGYTTAGIDSEYYLLVKGETKPKRVTKDMCQRGYCAASSDSSRLLVSRMDPHATGVNASYNTLHVIDVRTGKVKRIDADEKTLWCRGFWSPDGKQIAYQRQDYERIQVNPKGSRREGVAGALIVCDPDGRNPKTVLTVDSPNGLLGIALPQLIGWFPSRPLAKANAPVPKAAKDPGIVWLYHAQTGRLLAYRPNGDLVKDAKLPFQHRFLGLTPDGTKYVYAEKGIRIEPDGATGDVPDRLHLRGIEDGSKPVDLGVDIRSNWAWNPLSWSPDGTEFFVNRTSGGFGGNGFTTPAKHAVTRYTAAGKELGAEEFTEQEPVGWWPDGKSLLLLDTAQNAGAGRRNVKLLRHELATGKQSGIWSISAPVTPLLSPDGSSVLWFGTSSAGDGSNGAIFRHDLKAKTTTEIVTHEKPTHIDGRWSFDGKRIAYGWCQVDPTKPMPLDGPWQVVVCDTDGKNAVALRTDKESPGTVVAGRRPRRR